MHYLFTTFSCLVFLAKEGLTGSNSPDLSPSRITTTSSRPSEGQICSGGRSHEIPDLNEYALEYHKDEGDDHQPSTSTDKKEMRERLQEERKKQRNKRRTEKRKLLSKAEKEKFNLQASNRQNKYRKKLKQTIGFPSLQMKRDNELKALKQDGKATDEQIEELNKHIQRTLESGKKSKAKYRAKMKAEKKD